MSGQDDLSAWGDAMAEQAAASETGGVDDWAQALSEQEAAALDSLEADKEPSKNKVDLDVLLDIPVTLQLEIGRAKVSIRNLLSYTQGSVIEMDRLAGEPLDLLANGTLIAHGEVVVINDKFGVRLTDVVSPQERIKKLK
ncbi:MULTISPECIES: flagellar motor switch protein FliN [Thiomicrorhabdus]|uniref:Flagellar motor switch protein FliN n=1 Tax=Thiomicrorhabdus heinhorstiae TaxID=2748010 RepID=A0ABS0BZB4_9GAMM|nr:MULTISPECIES: flagellar motor switch protein FliN [Thiomicrorhabdus]MBF6058370.1 flagellar motor switch protein FliN [Thiomicrorhabdus heinhorstiae]